MWLTTVQQVGKSQLLTRGNLNTSQKLQTGFHVLADVSIGQAPYYCTLNIDRTVVLQAALKIFLLAF